MDIDDIRRANIRALEAEAGSATAAADRVEMSYSQYLNYRNGAKEAKTGKVRGMRKETAWRFEDAFRKPRGWLDQDHSEPPATPRALNYDITHYAARRHHARPLVQTLIELGEQISDDGLHELVGFARCLTSTHPLTKAKRKSST